MGAACSVDLGRKAVRACERGTDSQAEVTRFSGVSLASVEKLLRLRRRSGALQPDPERADRPGLQDAAACELVQRWLARQNDLAPAELAKGLQTQCGLAVSNSWVHRLLQRLHMRRKKTVDAGERDTAAVLLARWQLRARLASCPCRQLKLVEESGCNISMSRSRAGQRRWLARAHSSVTAGFPRGLPISRLSVIDQ
jgi:transposase